MTSMTLYKLTTTKNLVNKLNVGPIFRISDHRIITFNINVKEAEVKATKETILGYRGQILLDSDQYCKHRLEWNFEWDEHR